jgi:A/G-specific adenine glycosylase
MKKTKKFHQLLNKWYEQNQIDFAWQNTQNPYHALVAGFCAQQTQITRVIQIWKKIIHKYPELKDIAKAETSDLLIIWSNTGYPKRIINLKKTCEIILNKYNGKIPLEKEHLLNLPGVGPYTASIIECYGYKKNIPAIDINFERILGRFFLGKNKKNNNLDKILDDLSKINQFSFWNPAIMDFGALICKSKPKCEICILNKNCSAFINNIEMKIKSEQIEFHGSNRYYRGKILKNLRERKNNNIQIDKLYLELEQLPDKLRFQELLIDLNKDDLIWIKGNKIGLGANKKN